MNWFEEERTIGKVHLKNGFIMESGPYGYCGESIIACMKAGFAAVSTETLSLTNGKSPWWNIWRDGNNLYNCSKWSDIPIVQWIEKEIPKAVQEGAVIAATVGHTVEDMKEYAPLLDKSGVAAIKACTYRADQIVGLVEQAKLRSSLPVWAKISSNWPNYLELAKECVQAGADALVAIDTIGPVTFLQANGDAALGVTPSTGWMSGECIHAKALDVVRNLKETLDVPVVGVGGVMEEKGALRMKAAGADAIGLCSTILINGLCQLKMIRENLLKLEEEDDKRHKTYLDRNIRSGEPHIFVDAEKCINCGECIKHCGYMALAMFNGKLACKDENCRRCGLCEQFCAEGAIRIKEM